MASLFEHLMDTMPFAAALHAGEAKFGRPLARQSIAEVKRYFRFLANDESFNVRAPATPPKPSFYHEPAKGKGDKKRTLDWAQEQKLWSWKHDAEEPFKVADLWCRVRQAGYGSYKVLDAVEWGSELNGVFKNNIRIRSMTGMVFELPLTKEFVMQKWVIHAGWIPYLEERLWPLEALLDSSLVIALSYDIDSETGQILPTRKVPPRDDGEKDARDIEKQALSELRGWADDIPPEDPQIEDRGELPPLVTLPEPWGSRVQTDGTFMQSVTESGLVTGVTGDHVPSSTGAARVLVVLSLACCRERSDYEPGGIVGMARLYPHVMFKTNIPLEKIEASIRMRRPARTTTADPWDGWPDSPRNCCLKYDRPMEELTGGLWADENTNIVGFPLDLAAPPLPFWSNLFSYYLPDAYARIGDERMHVVRTDRPDPRIAEDLVTRNPVLKLFDVSEIAKVPRQGEFDNVHMAPKLEIARVVKAHFPTPTESPATKTRTSGYLSPGTSTTIDREKCFMTDIVMAPFCAHDCFHMHWRWATVSNPIWNRGWDDTSPHRQAGAPLVPPNQDVWVSMQAPAACDYHVAVGPSADSYFIAPYEWQVIMHHGAAYALDTSDWVTMQRAQLAVDTLGCDAEFYDDEGNRVRVDDSTALFYWLLRYDADFAGNELVGNERTQFADGGLDEARDL